MTHEDEIFTAVETRILDRHHIGGGFNDAQQALIPMTRLTNQTALTFAVHAAIPAMAQDFQRIAQRAGQHQRAITVFFQQVEGHALGGLGPHAGQ
jgi:hypothetical protein